MMRSKVNYKKIYGYGNIPKGWDVHHIDWDAGNNQKDNLIAIPKIIHKIIHSIDLISEANSNLKVLDIMDVAFIKNLIDVYKKHKDEGKNEDEIEDVLLIEINPLFEDESLIKVSQEQFKKRSAEWTMEEILRGRHHYPKGKDGDAIYDHIFGGNS